MLSEQCAWCMQWFSIDLVCTLGILSKFGELVLHAIQCNFNWLKLELSAEICEKILNMSALVILESSWYLFDILGEGFLLLKYS